VILSADPGQLAQWPGLCTTPRWAGPGPGGARHEFRVPDLHGARQRAL